MGHENTRQTQIEKMKMILRPRARKQAEHKLYIVLVERYGQLVVGYVLLYN